MEKSKNRFYPSKRLLINWFFLFAIDSFSNIIYGQPVTFEYYLFFNYYMGIEF